MKVPKDVVQQFNIDCPYPASIGAAEYIAQRAYDYALSQPVSMEPVATTEVKYSRLWLKIGVQSFCIDYTPEDEPEWSAGDAMVWMQKQLDTALSNLTAAARQQGAEDQTDKTLEAVRIASERIADLEQKNVALLEALKEALEIMKADWQQIDQEWGPSEGGLEAAMDGRLTGYGYFQKAIAAIQAAEVKP